MIQLDKTIISLDVFEEYFVCDIDKCKGICCFEGNSGAPLTDEEISIIENDLEKILPYVSSRGVEAIKKNNFYYQDLDFEIVTTLIDNDECAFAIIENGNYKCAIEKAWEEGKITFQKPISCHLYPIRIQKYHNYDAINYSKWDICKHACLKGKKLKVSVKDFLKAPLIRKYGEEWYNKLDEIDRDLKKSKDL